MRRSNFYSKKKFGSVSMKGKNLENRFAIIFSKMDLSNVGGYFPIWGLKIGIMVHPGEPQGGEKCCLWNHPIIPPGYPLEHSKEEDTFFFYLCWISEILPRKVGPKLFSWIKMHHHLIDTRISVQPPCVTLMVATPGFWNGVNFSLGILF